MTVTLLAPLWSASARVQRAANNTPPMRQLETDHAAVRLLQHHDDELHRGVVVVEQDHLEHRRRLGLLRLSLGNNRSLAVVGTRPDDRDRRLVGGHEFILSSWRSHASVECICPPGLFSQAPVRVARACLFGGPGSCRKSRYRLGRAPQPSRARHGRAAYMLSIITRASAAEPLRARPCAGRALWLAPKVAPAGRGYRATIRAQQWETQCRTSHRLNSL